MTGAVGDVSTNHRQNTGRQSRVAEERVYVNGRWYEPDAAPLSFDDRGFLFGDAVYEVVRLYDGRPFRLQDHLERLERSQRGIWMENPVPGETLAAVCEELTARSQEWPDANLYIQISRGTQRRNHAIPHPAPPPTLVAWSRPVTPIPDADVRRGIVAVTVPDDRWAKCWIKTVNLLPNVLAKEKARRAGAYDALFVRDGMVIEATSANLFAVFEGAVRTAPVSNYILPGITREVVLELAAALDVPVVLEPIPLEMIFDADEVFITGTNTEVLPVTTVDGRAVGSGIGPVTERLLRAYRQAVGREWVVRA